MDAKLARDQVVTYIEHLRSAKLLHTGIPTAGEDGLVGSG